MHFPKTQPFTRVRTNVWLSRSPGASISFASSPLHVTVLLVQFCSHTSLYWDIGAWECSHLAIPVERIDVELSSSSYRSAPETGNAACWARSTRRTATKAWKEQTHFKVQLSCTACSSRPLIWLEPSLEWCLNIISILRAFMSQNTCLRYHGYCDIWTFNNSDWKLL